MLGLSLGINKINRLSGDSYSDEYQAIVDYANGAAIALPSKSQQVLQDVLVQSLVAEGIWNLLDGLWVFATDSEEFALINWINPGNFSFVKSATPPTFVSNVGFKQNAVNMTLTSTGFFTSGSPNFQQGNASVLTHIYSSNTNAFHHDIQATQYMFFSSSFGSGNYRLRLNSTQDNTRTNTHLTGLFQINRESGSYKVFWNGVDESWAITQTNNFRATGSLLTTPASNAGFSMIAAGAGLAAKAAAFYTAWNTYRTSL